MQGTQPIFYNNYKWSVTFKNCESLCCTPVTYIILYIKYTSIYKKLKKKKKKKKVNADDCGIQRKRN